MSTTTADDATVRDTTVRDTADRDTADPAARIGELRGQIDSCDAEIIELVQRRLAISREIGQLRAAAGGTRLSLAREQQVLAKFQSALGPDGTALGMMLLRQGRGRL